MWSKQRKQLAPSPWHKSELNTFILRGETEILGIEDHTAKLGLKPKYFYSKYIYLPKGMKNQDGMCMDYIVSIKSHLPSQISSIIPMVEKAHPIKDSINQMKLHKSHIGEGNSII